MNRVYVQRAKDCYYPKKWTVVNVTPFATEVTYVTGAKEARRLARRLRSSSLHALKLIRCRECKEPYSIACRLYVHNPDKGSYTVEYLCVEHAAKAGYCPGCGDFIAGVGGMGVYCDCCEPEFEEWLSVEE